MKRTIIIVAAVLAAGLAVMAHASPKVDICKAWNNDDADHMAILSRLTHSTRDDYSRYDEDIPGAFCEGNINLVDQWIDQGYVRGRDVEAIARSMGISYKTKPRTPQGRLYEKILDTLQYHTDARGITDIYHALASNIAYEYVYKPKSQCAILIRPFLTGAVKKIPDVDALSSYCNPSSQN